VSGPIAFIVQWTWSVDDLVNSQRFSSRAFRLFLTAVALVIGSAGLFLALTSSGWLGPAMIAYALLDLALLYFRPLGRFLMGHGRYASLAHTANDLVVTEDGIVYTTRDNERLLRWHEIAHIREDSHIIGLFSGTSLWLAVPKRAFEVEADAHAFLGAIRTRRETG
jgi:hypothetical protein